YRGNDGGSSGTSQYHKQFVILFNDGGSHTAQHPLLWLDAVDFIARQPKLIGHTGLGREIIHFIVHKKTTAIDPYLGAKIGIDRRCDGYRISVFVYDREMSGLDGLYNFYISLFDGRGWGERGQIYASHSFLDIGITDE